MGWEVVFKKSVFHDHDLLKIMYFSKLDLLHCSNVQMEAMPHCAMESLSVLLEARMKFAVSLGDTKIIALK